MTWEETIYWLRSQPEMQKLVLDAYYDDPLIEAAKRYSKSTEWAEIKKIISYNKGRVLDVGAGRGISSYAFVKEDYQVFALEPDASELVGLGAIEKLSKDNHLQIDARQGFSESLPFESGFFDVVFVRALLHHTSDLEKSCKEFFRVLKPNGILIAAREHVITKKSDLPEFLKIHPLHKYYGGENAFLLNEYTGAFKNAGFTIEKTFKPFDNPINYSPRSKTEISIEVAEVLAKKTFLPRKALISLFKNKIVWSTFLSIMSVLDNRPGRLYSFVCKRPDNE